MWYFQRFDRGTIHGVKARLRSPFVLRKRRDLGRPDTALQFKVSPRETITHVISCPVNSPRRLEQVIIV